MSGKKDGVTVRPGAYAHVYRIRVDGEGTSAAELESYFGLTTARIQRGLGLPLSVVQQVIELAKHERVDPVDAKSPYAGTWYQGRLVLVPDLAEQGYDNDNGMHLLDPKAVGVSE